MKKTFLLSIAALFPILIISPCFSDTPAAGSREAVTQQIRDIDIQLKQAREDMQKLLDQKYGLNDKATALRAQKQINKLNGKEQDLTMELQAARGKNDAEKIEELNGALAAVHKEQALQNDTLALIGRLKDARAAGDRIKARSIEDGINRKMAAINGLYKQGPAAGRPGKIPAVTPTPEDSEVQSLSDELKTIDTQLKVYKDKMAALKAQRVSLKQQLQNMK